MSAPARCWAAPVSAHGRCRRHPERVLPHWFGTRHSGGTDLRDLRLRRRWQTKRNAITYGWSVGAGLDVMVMPNAFLRAEIDYVRFAPMSDIKAAIASGRIGGGLKF